MDAKKSWHYVLTVSCPDAVGLVAAVSGLIATWGGWLTEVANHSDRVTGHFFMRNEVAADSLDFGIDEFRRRFAPLAEKHRMRFEVHDSAVPRRVMILVSRQEHCLADLLHRWRTRELQFDLRGVVSNHEHLRSFVEWHDVRYHHVPVAPESKEAAFDSIGRLLEAEEVDRVILARYMQILPPARW
ncbi:MAG: formyltransferase family protein, partial [Vicinamibacteria bacterium]